MIICSSVRNRVEDGIEGTHVLVFHNGEFLEFVLPMVNVNLEHVVGLFLDLFLPLAPTQK